MKQTTANKPKSTGGNTSSAESAENFSFGSGSVYGDVADYISENRTFDILAIAFEAGRGYEGGDRWALTVKAADRETEILTLGSNPNRDEQLRPAQAYLDGGVTIKNKRLRMSGNAYYLVDGDR
ncbi:MAG: hypothetical protein WAK11_04455 [Candidatus Cybelea sp.]